MIMLLSITTAALSCSMESPANTDLPNENFYTVVVSGTASDKGNGTPLKGIRIRLHAAEIVSGSDGEVRTTTIYTDERGYFTLTADGFTRPISCTITAEDSNGIYGFARHDLNISWSGTSFDEYTGYFYVNDCDFYMEKLLKSGDYSPDGFPSDSRHCFGEQPTILTNCL